MVGRKVVVLHNRSLVTLHNKLCIFHIKFSDMEFPSLQLTLATKMKKINGPLHIFGPSMSGKNWWLVADEPVEGPDFRKFTDHFRGIYRIYLK